jgi:fructose-1,6-bisphosphatase/inositol monophosphatase family enzyme
VICDPLDGSHNAQVGIPFFSLSLCVIPTKKERTFGNVSHGLVMSIKTDDEYFAAKGTGAYHNGEKLPKRRSPNKRIETMLVETGDIDFLRDRLIHRLSLKLILKPRILGSAALSFCLLADGSADAYIFAQPRGARTIDSPAGYLIARETGCVFADLSGRNSDIDDVRVGFDSKLDLIGAPDRQTLERLRKLVRIV